MHFSTVVTNFTSASKRKNLAIPVVVLAASLLFSSNVRADWNVSISASANRQSAAQLEGNNSIYEPGSVENPYLLCKDQSITIAWTAQITGAPPTDTKQECDLVGPQWSWTGEESKTGSSSISILRNDAQHKLTPGMHKFTENAKAKYTYQPKSNAPPGHACASPGSKSRSKKVYVSVSDHSSAWETYHSPQVVWPSTPDEKPYDFVINFPNGNGGGTQKRYEGTIKVARKSRHGHWIPDDTGSQCGQKITSSSSTNITWYTKASVSLTTAGGFVNTTLGTGLSSSVSKTQVKSYSFGGTSGVQFRWRIEIPGWNYFDHREKWEKRKYDSQGNTEEWKSLPDNHTVKRLKSIDLLANNGSDFAKQWKCCG